MAILLPSGVALPDLFITSTFILKFVFHIELVRGCAFCATFVTVHFKFGFLSVVFYRKIFKNFCVKCFVSPVVIEKN